MSTRFPLNVLVVDENTSERSLVRHLAEGLGWTVDEAASVREMTAWLGARPPANLGCVVVAYPLSDGDGFDALAASRAMRADFPLVLLVEDNDADVMLRLLKSGAAGYLEKTALSESRLGQVIRRAMRSRGANTFGEHALLVTAFQQLSAAVLVTDRFGNVLLHNARWLDLLGQTLGTLDNVADMLERAPSTTAATQGPSALTQMLQSIVDNQLQPAEFCLSLDNEQTVEVRLTQSPILDETGQLVGSVAILEDMPTRQQPRVIQRVCHDLRNPLSAIIINANILSRDASVLNEQRVKLATRILSSATRMNGMIENMFDYAMAAQGKELPMRPQDADLNAVVTETLAGLRSEFPGRSLVFDASGDLRGRWDPTRLRQMLHSLVALALKRGTTRASLHIECAELADPPSVDIRLDVMHDSLNVDLTVLPQEPASAEPSFDPGLFLAERIVEAHQGTLEVVAENRETTRFVIRLPKPAISVDEHAPVPVSEQQA